MQVYRRTVAGEYYLLAVAEEMVEYMEEGVDGLACCSPLLNVVDDEYVDGEVEIDEVVDHVAPSGIGKLHLEQSRRDVKDTFLRI